MSSTPIRVFPLTSQNAHLARRAISAFAKIMRLDLGYYYVPDASETRVLIIDGRSYVGLLNSVGSMVALYRLNNRGSLKLLKRHPCDGIMKAIGDFDESPKDPDDEADFIEDGNTPTPEPDFIEDGASPTADPEFIAGAAMH
jgi:hypothetical protein